MKKNDYFEKASEDYDKMIKEVESIDSSKDLTDDVLSDDDSYLSKVYEKQEDELMDRTSATVRDCIKKLKEEGKL